MQQEHTPRINHRWYAAFYDNFEKLDKKNAAKIRSQAPQAHGRVLEAGMGTGGNLAHYDWSKVESLDGTEPDLNMLARARTKLLQLPAEVQAKVRLHQMTAEALDFPDDHFDTLLCTLVLCTVYDPRRAIAEMRRVLKPDGELRLVEHVAAEGFTGGVQRFVQPLYGRMSGNCQLHRHTELALRDAGLQLDVSERFSLGPVFPAFIGVARKQS